jgi:ABC-type nitrate/sulfonate/bicarbonate transport system permease component
VGAVSGEYMVGTNPKESGLGYLLQIYWSRTDTAAVFAVAVIACVVGYFFVATVNYLGARLSEKKLIHLNQHIVAIEL